MSRRDYLGVVLTDKTRKRVWVGRGVLLPLTARMTTFPPLWGDPQDARRAARAIRKVLGLRLRPTACWAP
jgi:hypothetical protein